jgi:hypothetical protein
MVPEARGYWAERLRDGLYLSNCGSFFVSAEVQQLSMNHNWVGHYTSLDFHGKQFA